MHTSPHIPQPADGPERVPLATLAGRCAASPALTRVVPRAGARGTGRVAVAAFQSSV